MIVTFRFMFDLQFDREGSREIGLNAITAAER